jgi:hypothetical protein
MNSVDAVEQPKALYTDNSCSKSVIEKEEEEDQNQMRNQLYSKQDTKISLIVM